MMHFEIYLCIRISAAIRKNQKVDFVICLAGNKTSFSGGGVI
jgi:hypothetical protein